MSDKAKTSLSLDTFSFFSGGTPKHSQPIISSMSWVCLMVFTQLDMPETPLLGGVQDPKPPQLAPLDIKDQQLYLEDLRKRKRRGSRK